MIEIIDKALCSGCSACANICPNNCISMRPDKEGFLYPVVNERECIHCNKCDRICPIKNPLVLEKKRVMTYAVQSKDQVVLRNCTSGGAFTAIAKEAIKKGWFIVGATFGQNLKVQHIVIDDLKSIGDLSGSKYVQSDVNDVYKDIHSLLEKGETVVFCGTPCQVAGIIRANKEYAENLYTIDLVCHGVPSPLVWEKYLEFSQSRYGKIKSINFRSKRFGYHVTVMEEEYESGITKYGSARSHMMSRIFFKNIADRPICYHCPFKTVNRISDVTLFDCWHFRDITDGKFDNDKGYTSAIVRTKKGAQLIESIIDIAEIIQIDTDKAIAYDGKMMTNSVHMHPMRDSFYKCIEEENLACAVKRYIPIKWYDHQIDSVKSFLYKVGAISWFKRLKDIKHAN